MTADRTLHPAFPAARMAMALSVTAGIGALVAMAVMMGWQDQWRQAIAAAVTAAGCLAGSLGSLELVRRASKVEIGRIAAASIGGMSIRLGVSVVAAAIAARTLGLTVRSAAAWTMTWYLLLLLVEVTMFVRYFRRVSAGVPGRSFAEAPC